MAKPQLHVVRVSLLLYYLSLLVQWTFNLKKIVNSCCISRQRRMIEEQIRATKRVVTFVVLHQSLVMKDIQPKHLVWLLDLWAWILSQRQMLPSPLLPLFMILLHLEHLSMIGVTIIYGVGIIPWTTLTILVNRKGMLGNQGH